MVATRGDSPGRGCLQIMLTRRNVRGEPGPSPGSGGNEDASEALYREQDEEWEDTELGRDDVDEAQPYKVHIVYQHEILASGVQTVADAGVAYGLMGGIEEHVLRSLRAVWSPLTGVSHEARIAECVLQGDAAGPNHGSSSRRILPRACRSFPRHATADTRFDLHDGVGWNLVFRQENGGSLLQKGEWEQGSQGDRENPKATYSRLSQLEDYRNADGKLTLALVMQGTLERQPFTNVWRQTSNPVDFTSPSPSSLSSASCTGAFECGRSHSDQEHSDQEHSVLGYQALSIEDDSYGWGGLRASKSRGALLDGSIDLDHISRQCSARERSGSHRTERPIIGYVHRPPLPLSLRPGQRVPSRVCTTLPRARSGVVRWKALTNPLGACAQSCVGVGRMDADGEELEAQKRGMREGSLRRPNGRTCRILRARQAQLPANKHADLVEFVVGATVQGVQGVEERKPQAQWKAWLYACNDDGALERGFFVRRRSSGMTIRLLGPMGVPLHRSLLPPTGMPLEIAMVPHHVLEELSPDCFFVFSINGNVIKTVVRGQEWTDASWPLGLLNLCPHNLSPPGVCLVADWMRSESPPRLWHYIQLPVRHGAATSSMHVMLVDQSQTVLAETWLDVQVHPHPRYGPRLLVGTGGVASTAFLRHVAVDHRVLSPPAGALQLPWNKHERYPRTALDKPAPGTRVLYLFADPLNVVTYFLNRTDDPLRSLRLHCEMMGLPSFSTRCHP